MAGVFPLVLFIELPPVVIAQPPISETKKECSTYEIVVYGYKIKD